MDVQNLRVAYDQALPGLRATWDPVAGVSEFAVLLLDGSGHLVEPPPAVSFGSDGASPSATLTGSSVQVGQTYHLVVLPQRAPDLTVDLAAPAAPARATLSEAPASATLHLSWTAVSGASSYEAQLLHAGALVSPAARWVDDAGGLGARVAWGILVPGQSYSARVRAHTATGVGYWVSSGSVTVSRSAQPQDLQASFDGEAAQLDLSWQPVPSAAHYELRAEATGSTGAGSPLTGSPWTLSASPAQVDASSLTNGQKLQLDLVAQSTELGEGAAASTSLTVLLLSPPGAPTLSDAEDAIKAKWNSVLNATGYEVQVGRGGSPLSPQPPVVVVGTNAKIDGRTLVRGGAYTVRVRATAAEVLGPWSDPSPITFYGGRDPITEATSLMAEGEDVFAVAQALHSSYGDLLDATRMASVLTAVFPGATAVQRAIALQRTAYTMPGLAHALSVSSPGLPAADLTYALRVAFPPADLVAQLKSASPATLPATVAAARERFSGLDALAMSVAIQQGGVAVHSSTYLASVLRGGTYTLVEVAPALRALFPNISAAELAHDLIQADQA